MKIFLKATGRILLFGLLTLITQIGGLIYILTTYTSYKLRLSKRTSTLLFLVIYLSVTFIIVPYVAPLFGRVNLPLSGTIRPLNVLTCILNRHYVNRELNDQLTSLAEEMSRKYPNTKTNYLDANFPFFDGFPLIPHLSHSDGKKIDIAFFYENEDAQEMTNSAPSFIGYGIYEQPEVNEKNTSEECTKRGFWQYNFLSYMVPTWGERSLQLDTERTRYLIQLLADHKKTSKIFIEPHLRRRWKLMNYNKIRFHGCHAVRHDDHIHLQIN